MLHLHPSCLVALVVGITLSIATTFAHDIEPWYRNLSHFGPLDLDYDGGWNFRDMRLVDDYTFRIDRIPGSPLHPFMFVSPTAAPHPPLGLRNWKQGKIGVGVGGTTIPGGGGGTYPFKGVFNITLRTDGHPTSPRTITLDSAVRFPSLRITSTRQVVPVGDGPVRVRLQFSEPCN